VTLLSCIAYRRGAVGLLAVAVGACLLERAQASSPPKQPAPGAKAAPANYQPLRFADVSGWEEDDHAAAFKAFVRSCTRVLALQRERSTEKAPPPAPPPAGLVEACNAAGRQAGPMTREAAKAFFEQHFTPNALVHRGPQGLLTGYYEPVLLGSRTQEGAFTTPIYRRPPDLVTVVEETQRAAPAAGGLTHGRKTEKGVEPYATRAEIEQGALNGQNLELLYFADAVDVFFMHIQGSGRVKLTDGSMVRVHYDGKNGHPYRSIGRYLIEKGLLAADKISMGALKRWLRADPKRGRDVMWQNASFVFFRELKGPEAKGTIGAMQAPLTAGRSLAVDPAYHSLGLPVFVSAEGMRHVNKATGAFRRLMVAQDVGSAIKGPERGDIYFGSGDAAGPLAMSTKHTGKFIVLLPTATPARADATPAAAAPEKASQ
jgi:membrane-bound lytic murein transglycosylase A